MCFSAPASFISSAVLCTTGIASVKTCSSANQRWFAAVPLLFGTQQFFEGFVWYYLNEAATEYYDGYAAGAFLFFALVLWPVWVPWSVFKMESQSLRKRIILALLIIGAVFSLITLVMLFVYPSRSSINGYHILYELDYPMRNSPIATIIYLSVTLLPLLLSSLRYVPLLGLLIFGSYMVTFFFYSHYIFSVWCFFAAIISALIFLMVSDKIKVFKR